MYIFWRSIGWISTFGSAIGLGIISVLLYHIVKSGIEPMITVDTFLRLYMSYIYWVRSLAEYLFPDALVGWVFALPAIILFPIRFTVSTMIGIFAFSQARKYRS